MAFYIHRYLPKTGTDLFAFSFLIFAIHAIGFFELLYVLPLIYSTEEHGNKVHPWLYIHRFSGFFIYFNVLINLYKTITTNTSIRGKVLPSIMRKGWRFCYVCESNAPPRSFHCHMCNICILQRDHHCTFTGTCVGFANQRYYIGLLFYMTVAAGYSCMLNIDFIYHIFGSITFTTVLTIAFPMISWIFVHSDLVTGFQVFMTSLSLIGLFMSCGLLMYHMNNIFHGQSVHEKTYKIRDYDLGWRNNFESVLGSRWTFCLLSPLIPSKQAGDGIEFKTRTEHDSIKSM